MIENNINSTGFQNEDKGDMVSVMELIIFFDTGIDCCWYCLAMGGAYLPALHNTHLHM